MRFVTIFNILTCLTLCVCLSTGFAAFKFRFGIRVFPDLSEYKHVDDARHGNMIHTFG